MSFSTFVLGPCSAIAYRWYWSAGWNDLFRWAIWICSDQCTYGSTRNVTPFLQWTDVFWGRFRTRKRQVGFADREWQSDEQRCRLVYASPLHVLWCWYLTGTIPFCFETKLFGFFLFWFARLHMLFSNINNTNIVVWFWRGSHRLGRRCYWTDNWFHVIYTFFNHSQMLASLEDIQVCFSFDSIVL